MGQTGQMGEVGEGTGGFDGFGGRVVGLDGIGLREGGGGGSARW
jgi:hypothetical protein